MWPWSSIGQLWIAVWLVRGCIGLARLRRRTLVIREILNDFKFDMDFHRFLICWSKMFDMA